MTEEIQKAIDELECFEPDDLFECALYRECVNEIKNLIEKQSKEIEVYEERIRLLNKTVDDYIEENKNLKEIEKEHQEENGKLRQYIKELEEKVEKYRGEWD